MKREGKRIKKKNNKKNILKKEEEEEEEEGKTFHYFHGENCLSWFFLSSKLFISVPPMSL